MVKQLWNLKAFVPFIAEVPVPAEAEVDVAARVKLLVACMNVRDAVNW
jgi:hypothetical protein